MTAMKWNNQTFKSRHEATLAIKAKHKTLKYSAIAKAIRAGKLAELIRGAAQPKKGGEK